MQLARVLFCCTVLTALSGCDELPTETGDPTVGTYHLQSVDGGALPYTLVDSISEKVSLIAGAIRLDAGGAVSRVMRLDLLMRDEPYGGSSYQRSSTGVWSLSGDVLHIAFANGVVVSGTMVDGGFVLTETLKEPIDGNHILSVDQMVSLAFRR